MQKVEGSSPFSRFARKPRKCGAFSFPETGRDAPSRQPLSGPVPNHCQDPGSRPLIVVGAVVPAAASTSVGATGELEGAADQRDGDNSDDQQHAARGHRRLLARGVIPRGRRAIRWTPGRLDVRRALRLSGGDGRGLPAPVDQAQQLAGQILAHRPQPPAWSASGSRCPAQERDAGVQRADASMNSRRERASGRPHASANTAFSALRVRVLLCGLPDDTRPEVRAPSVSAPMRTGSWESRPWHLEAPCAR